MRFIHLRIKVKTLAAEARIIRCEARRVVGDKRADLNQHRTGILRRTARENQLAYCLLRGVPYRLVEARCREKPSFEKVSKIARRFGGLDEDISCWVVAAQEHLKTSFSPSKAA